MREREERFERLAAEVLEPLRRFLARRTDPDTADDVLADTLLVAWRRFDEVPEPDLPWLYGVARGCLANAVRGRRRRARLAERVAALDPPGRPTSGPGHDGGGGDDDADERVRAAIDRLPAAQAEVVRLWAWEQLEPAEIAVVLGVSANAVSTRLHRARAKLAEQLRKDELGAGQEQVRGGSDGA